MVFNIWNFLNLNETFYNFRFPVKSQPSYYELFAA
jgi:hypothetical protein